MPITEPRPVKDLSLDLNNYRTVPQTDELSAVQAMITISPDYFWGLLDSMLTGEGYLPTENILVLDEGTKLTVREGNRRVAVLKIIHGILSAETLGVPDSHKVRIHKLTTEWLAANASVPCAIYPLSDAATVDRIVTLAHGKGDKASRNKWNAVARARHSRDVQKVAQPALDILEKYVKHGTNLNSDQAKRWAGDYPLTVLEEAIEKYYPRLGASSTIDLAAKYPNIPYHDELDSMLLKIGLQTIKTRALRAKDVAAENGIPKDGAPSENPPENGDGTGVDNPGQDTEQRGNSNPEGNGAAGDNGVGANNPEGNNNAGNEPGGGNQEGTNPPVGGDNPGGATNPGGGDTPGGSNGTGNPGGAPGGSNVKPAIPLDDPRSVIQQLRKFNVLGDGREKVVSLKNEAQWIDLNKSPIAFCLLLRSMFEISAKAYCDEQAGKPNAPTATLSNGRDKELVEVLKEIYNYMINPPGGEKDKAKERHLFGAMQAIKTPESILSITSMNQLIHHRRFSVRAGDVSAMFHNIYPLLEALNKP